MAVLYWKCPICGAEAGNEEEKQNHLKKMVNDLSHNIFRSEEIKLERILVV